MNRNWYYIKQGASGSIPPATVSCAAGSVSFSGNQGLFLASAITVGSGVGPVTASFEAQGVPDRIQIEYNGAIVADSLFVGDGLITSPNSYIPAILATTSFNVYNYNGSGFVYAGYSQSVSYTMADIADTGSVYNRSGNYGTGGGNGPGQIGVIGSYPYPISNCADGTIKVGFYKSTQYPAIVNIIVTGGPSGTAWSLVSLTCPSS
jgi:hypothetical protein